jgi:hypothetical protein
MTIFEVESWRVAEGREKEHEEAMRQWLKWTKEHRELFPEWKSLKYYVKYVAGDDSERHIVIWEYESLTAFDSYKNRRSSYEGPYKEYKKNDPYYKGVFNHSTMSDEFWKPLERDLWLE